MMKYLIYWSLLAVIAISVSCKKNTEEKQVSDFIKKGDTIIITENSTLSQKLKTITVSEQPSSKEVTATATIKPCPNQLAYINLPFHGRIVKTYIKLGQNVAANTPLFEVISSDFIAMQKDFFNAQSEKELAAKDLKRKEDLFKNGVSSQKELDEATSLFKVASKEYENMYAAIKIFYPHPEQMVLGQPLIIRSPIAGEVVENNLVLGEYVNDDSKHAATIANLSQVWVTANVKEKDIRFVKEKEELTFQAVALPGQTFTARIFHISDVIDDETRSFEVIGVCDNRDKKLKVGMYANVDLKTNGGLDVIAPEKSLMQDEKNSYVLVQIAPGKFVKRIVELGSSKDGNTVVINGLKKGETIIAQGSYYLK